MTLLERVMELRHVDPIINAAFRAHGDDMDAVCAALLASSEDRERLVKLCADLQAAKPVVVKMEKPDV